MKSHLRLRASRHLGGLLRAAFCALTIVACGRAGLDPFPQPSGGGGSGASSPSSHSSTGTMPTTSSSSVSSSNAEGGAGGGPACLVAQDCEDNDPCTSNKCDGGHCNFPLRDDDNDGVVAVECGGFDCNDLNPNVFPGHPEDCHDGADNDCNGVADCFDPACENVPDCGCVPSPSGEDCTNNIDDDCDTKVDCNDPDCQGTPACGCLANESGHCQNGFDDDCDGQIDCDDSDCASTPECQCQTTPESCDDGVDNDCDLLVDCADPDCAGLFPCACVPPGFPEVCNDGVDNDCDGLPDCQDPDCTFSPSCQMCTPEICTDGLDNDCDGKIDCADPACSGAPNCAPQPEICNNGLDDDLDGHVDCADTDCSNTPICVTEHANCLSPQLITGSGSFFGDTTGHVSETNGSCGGAAGEAVFFFVLSDPSFVHIDSIGTSFDSTVYVRTGVCNTGHEIGCDDDSGGSLASSLTFNILYPGTYFVFLDGFTVDPNFGPNEGPYQLNVTINPNPPEICHDGIDNDGDSKVDCADPDCTFDGSCFHCNNGNDPEPEWAPGRCTDGLDNDCDGFVDCADHDDCHASDVYVTECCNGLDETNNNVIDDFACKCGTTADCQAGQICYDHTLHTCAPPCNMFFGMICPFVAPGSFCNMATGQCEFP